MYIMIMVNHIVFVVYIISNIYIHIDIGSRQNTGKSARHEGSKRVTPSQKWINHDKPTVNQGSGMPHQV